MENKRTPIYGSMVNRNPVVDVVSPEIDIPGLSQGKQSHLKLNSDILSKHLMLIGGTGCGKSNVFYHIVSQLKKNMNENDVMIVFDTKGDYYSRFFDKRKDLIIGNSREYRQISESWNIFKEITADGWDAQSIEQNTHEVAWSIYREAIEKSKDPFFPGAARDLFATVLLCMIKRGGNDSDYKNSSFYNDELKRAFDESDIFDIKELIESYPEYSAALSYIGDGSTGQALGVYAEMQSGIRKIFNGVFASHGAFSIRNFVREKGARTLFVEYDLSIGNTLSPMYSLLFDLALKEALGRSKTEGNVYLICDEFKLLPFLQHIEDGVNFGRSLGVKVLAGLQSINQITEAYGEYKGKNIIAGFSSVFGFKANDASTREFISALYGKNYIQEHYKTLSNSIKEDNREANVVEDWELGDLNVGEAVIGLPFSKPFIFQFDLWKG